MLSFLINLGNKITEEKAKGVNVYHLLHYVWLIEIYYLILNSLSIFIIQVPEIKELADIIPPIINKYNGIIMNSLQSWSPFILLLSVGLFVASFFVSMSKHILFTKNSGVIFYHADAGLFFSKWLFIIALTYYVYTWTGKFLPLIMIILVLLTQGLKKFLSILETKYDITFR